MIRSEENYSFQKIVIIVAIILFILKIVAWYLTNSIAILTDALEGIVNIITAFIGLYSLYLANIPKDENHPYGHGKAEFISAAIEGTLISVTGLIIIYEAINNLKHTHILGKLDIGIGIIALTSLINFLVGFLAVRKGKKNKSLALIASGKHLETDTYSTFGIIVGLILIYFTHLNWLDSVIALTYALIIIVTGYKIIRSSIAGIMDEADIKLLNEVVVYLNATRAINWIDLHNLRIIKYGAVLHLDCHLTVPWYFNVQDAHEEVKKLEDFVKEKYGDSVEMFVHLDGCESFSCQLCQIQDCAKRQYPFISKVEWTMHNISKNIKHQL